MLKSHSEMTKIEGEKLECLSNDRNAVEGKNEYISSVKKDKEAIDFLNFRNGIDSIKEDSMTKVSIWIRIHIFSSVSGRHAKII